MFRSFFRIVLWTCSANWWSEILRVFRERDVLFELADRDIGEKKEEEDKEGGEEGEREEENCIHDKKKKYTINSFQ